MSNSFLVGQKKPAEVEVVLVEDDSLVRFLWRAIANAKGFRLSAFATVSEFLSEIERFSCKTRFYLDQDIGTEVGGGVKLARIIKDRFGAYTHMVTNHPRSEFVNELRAGIVDQVSGKFPPPFDNPGAYVRGDAKPARPARPGMIDGI